MTTTTKESGIKRRGFGSMDKALKKAIASKGGRAAHQKGTAHEWTSEEAREAGALGGVRSAAARAARKKNAA